MKTIFTLGPASEDEAILHQFCQTADRFRLNIAHLSLVRLKEWLDRLTAIFQAQAQTRPVVLDLQGAKMRLGSLPTCPQLPHEVTLFLGQSSPEIERLPVPHPDLFTALQIGDLLFLNEARLQLRVTHVGTDSATAQVLTNGALSGYKGINRAAHPVPFRQLTAQDQAALQLGLGYPFIQFACSFVFDGQEATTLRAMTADRHLIAKIERPESMAHLRQIDQSFDELWLCRGDLGAQAGLRALGALQADFVAQFSHLTKPKFLAGQVLEHLTHFPEPTRSEVVHLYDACQAGFDGIVLSDETAIGQYPLRVAEFLGEMSRG